MPKLKTKKTLMKRVKITKNGKIMKKQICTGHLKRKWNSSKKSRKNTVQLQTNIGHRKLFANMLGKEGKNIN